MRRVGGPGQGANNSATGGVTQSVKSAGGDVHLLGHVRIGTWCGADVLNRCGNPQLTLGAQEDNGREGLTGCFKLHLGHGPAVLARETVHRHKARPGIVGLKV